MSSTLYQKVRLIAPQTINVKYHTQIEYDVTLFYNTCYENVLPRNSMSHNGCASST